MVYLKVADLRGQHGELSAEADSTREKLSRQLQEKQEEIQQVHFWFSYVTRNLMDFGIGEGGEGEVGKCCEQIQGEV